jgi:uronate dehydrogenase
MPGMNQPKRVLVTGSAGRIGRAAVHALIARGHSVVGFDLVPTEGIPGVQSVIGSIQDPEAISRAADGVESLIHLAAVPDDARYPRGEPPDDGDNFLDELAPNNLVGAYHVMEVARKLKIPRVILASTGQVVDGYLQDGSTPVTVSLVTRPRYLYACTKVFLEAMGQVYARHHGIAVLAVRLGWCPRPGQVEEIRSSKLGQDVYLSPGDVGRFFVAAVEVEKLTGYAVVFATSRPVHQLRYDLEPARKLIGYEPQDRWPDGAEEFI